MNLSFITSSFYTVVAAERNHKKPWEKQRGKERRCKTSSETERALTITVGGKSRSTEKLSRFGASLRTDVFSVAKLRLADEAQKVERMRGSRAAVEAGKGTMGDLMRSYEERTRANPELKPASIVSFLERT